MPLPVYGEYRSLTAPRFPSRKKHLGWSIFLDVIIIIALLLVVLALYMFITPNMTYFRLDDPELMYPKTHIQIPSVMLAVLSFFGPALVIILCNIFFWWNPWDLYAGLLGLLFAWTLGLLLTGLLWVLMGGMR